MRLAVTTGVLGIWSGCFYTAPIERPPTVTVEPSPSDPSVRVDLATGFAVSAKLDAAHQPGTFQWTATACAGATDNHATDCDAIPFHSGPPSTISATDLAPPLTTISSKPVRAIHVELAAHDDRGVLATGDVAFDYLVANQLPTLALCIAGQPCPPLAPLPIDTPIQLFASYGDPDGAASNVMLQWMQSGPGQAMLGGFSTPTPSPTVPGELIVAAQLVPDAAGAWSVTAIATDADGGTRSASLPFSVAPDQPPCLAQWQPSVPPAGAALPITAPTRFQVPIVVDDLDPYPPVPGDPFRGTATFAWSILMPGASVRQPLLGATGNSIDFDPAAFAPGDMVELRVEVADRVVRPLPCADNASTCSVAGAPIGCLQRQTWRVEVR